PTSSGGSAAVPVDEDGDLTIGQGHHVTCTFTNTEEPPPVPVCSAGYVYAIGATGQMQQIDPDGNTSNFGQDATGVDSFNGLGIGANGQAVYAYERTNSSQTATVWEMDTATGIWSSTGESVNS